MIVLQILFLFPIWVFPTPTNNNFPIHDFLLNFFLFYSFLFLKNGGGGNNFNTHVKFYLEDRTLFIIVAYFKGIKYEGLDGGGGGREEHYFYLFDFISFPNIITIKQFLFHAVFHYYFYFPTYMIYCFLFRLWMTTEWLLERKDLKKNNNWKGNSHENNHWMGIHMITLCIKYLLKSPSPPLDSWKNSSLFFLPTFICGHEGLYKTGKRKMDSFPLFYIYYPIFCPFPSYFLFSLYSPFIR